MVIVHQIYKKPSITQRSEFHLSRHLSRRLSRHVGRQDTILLIVIEGNIVRYVLENLPAYGQTRIVLTGVDSKNDRFVRKKAGSHGQVIQSEQLIRKIPHFYGQVMTDVKKGRRSRSRKIIILSHPPHTTSDITDDITSDTTDDIDTRGC